MTRTNTLTESELATIRADGAARDATLRACVAHVRSLLAPGDGVHIARYLRALAEAYEVGFAAHNTTLLDDAVHARPDLRAAITRTVQLAIDGAAREARRAVGSDNFEYALSAVADGRDLAREVIDGDADISEFYALAAALTEEE